MMTDVIDIRNSGFLPPLVGSLFPTIIGVSQLLQGNIPVAALCAVTAVICVLAARVHWSRKLTLHVDHLILPSRETIAKSSIRSITSSAFTGITIVKTDGEKINLNIHPTRSEIAQMQSWHQADLA